MTTPALERRAPRAKVREYTGPLGILAAGVIGISLLCSVSAMAMGDLNRYVSVTLEPISIVDFAVANFQTAAALTEQVVTVFVPTETLVPTSTDAPATLTPQATDTQRRFVTITPTLPRRTRVPSTATLTPRPPTPTRTRTPVPPTATRTRTPVPPTVTRTNTPIPPTDTATDPPPPPTETYTSQPPDTETPLPPTNTEPPPQDTDTPLPVATGNSVLVPSSTPGP